MKKFLVMFIFLGLSIAINAQIFRPVAAFPDPKLLKAGETDVTHKWEWRFDATMVIAEVNRNKVTKEWATTSFSAVGPSVGYQKFVPKSAVDPTPVNVYGLAVGVALGSSIYAPQLAQAKVILAANLWEYFKFGVTYSVSPIADIAKVGFFAGGGITF